MYRNPQPAHDTPQLGTPSAEQADPPYAACSGHVGHDAEDDLRNLAVRLRAGVIVVPLLLLLVLLGARLVQIQVWQGAHWSKAAERQRRSLERLPACRGTITAGRETLVQSLQRATVIADLKLLKEHQDRQSVAQALAPLLNRQPDELTESMDRTDRRVVYLARHVEPEVEERIRALKLRGIGFEEDFRRSYPQGQLACHVLGFAGLDGGMEGLELKLDGLLRGVPGYRVYERDAARRPLSRGQGESFTPETRAPRAGFDLTLTLDPGIQFAAERELAKIMDKYEPAGATAVVLDTRTGAVLAMASYPGFDPNHPGAAGAASRRNRTVTDVYEPGSTFKTFIAAWALDKGAARRSERIDCQNGAWRLPWRTLHDSHAYGLLSFDDFLVKSSNIAAAKIGLRLGADEVHAAVTAFGFGQSTRSELPGEVSGLVRARRVWTKDSLLSIPMGQEIAVTPLQLAAAYAAMINGGVLLRPQVVAGIRSPRGEVLYQMKPESVRRVIFPATSAAMREILTRVVVDGTGSKAWCREYSIGGKTGTAQKVVNGTYSHEKYVGSFCGFAPADHPRLVCLVTVDEPHKGLGYYGGTVAAPAVGEILRRALPSVGVLPRSLQEQAAAEHEFKRRRSGSGD